MAGAARRCAARRARHQPGAQFWQCRDSPRQLSDGGQYFWLGDLARLAERTFPGGMAGRARGGRGTGPAGGLMTLRKPRCWRPLGCLIMAAGLMGMCAGQLPAVAAPGVARAPLPPGTPQTCSKNAIGQLVDCPPPVPHARLPRGARNFSAVAQPVRFLARLADTRTWTSSGGNTFPGADVPFGMVQWSPDTLPHRSDGGGYTYGDRKLTGYSLTHLSGPGCRAAGDIAILPMTGAAARTATRPPSRPRSPAQGRSPRPATTPRAATCPPRSRRSSPRRPTRRPASSPSRPAAGPTSWSS